MTNSINVYLDDLEARLDDADETRLAQEWQTFAQGHFTGQVFIARRACTRPAGVAWPSVLVNTAFADHDAMLLQQLAQCSSELANGGGALLTVRCNYGTPILPSVFGAKLFMMDDEHNTLPASHALDGGLDALRAVVARGVPPLNAGLWPRVIETAHHFRARLAPYPQISKHVHLYHPDLQGPMDCTEMLWGSGLFLDCVDEPALVHAVLRLVTDTYCAALRAWQALVPPRPAVNYHWGMAHGGTLMLRDDSAMNFSPAMFEEFILPYDQQVLTALGGGAVHFCGRGDHYIRALGAMTGLHAVNLSQPECNAMETIFANTIDRGVQLIGLRRDAVDAALARGRDLRGNVHTY